MLCSGEPAARALLASALEDKVKQVEQRAFLLLAVLYPDADMEQISAGLLDATAPDASRRRGNAVELLDNLLDRALKRRFLPLVEELPRAERLQQVAELFPPPGKDTVGLLTELLSDEAAWVRACATWCVAEAPTMANVREALLTGALGDASPYVREIALVALARAAPDRAAPHLDARLKDDAPLVRRQAERLRTRPSSSAPV
jgi:HEAT repeat protein